MTFNNEAFFSQCPTIMSPIHGAVPALEEGRMRYIIANKGLYLEALSRALHLRVLIQAHPYPLPYGDVNEIVQLRHGAIPNDLFEQFLSEARKNPRIEHAGLIMLNDANEYVYVQPDIVSKGVGHVSYHMVDADSVVIDMHTHGHADAYFSSRDNLSDSSGIWMSLVLGSMHKATPSHAFRSCVWGIYNKYNCLPWNSAWSQKRTNNWERYYG